MGQEIDGEILGETFKGYIFRITGGNDKQGFQMKQGILMNGRTRILFKKRGTGYKPTRVGERSRKSVRGCIIGPDICSIFLRVAKKGDGEIAGVTDVERPNRLGMKRRNHIIKTFYKSLKIQRLITEKRIRRKRTIVKARTDRF